MEGYFDMIRNYASHLYKTYEDMYNMDMNKAKPSKGKGLVKRPNEPSMIRPNDPKNLMQGYFASVKKMREQLNDTT